MKKNNYLLFMLFFAVATVFSSCKKDDEQPAKSKTELLSGTASKTWRMTNEEMVTAFGRMSTFDFMRDDCDKDNVTVFFTNQNVEEREGTTKCSSTDADLIDEYKWSLSSDEKKITMQYTGYDEVFNIVELSASTLKVEMVDADNTNIKIVYTYTAQ